jgi:hypothetical protein
MAQSRQEEYGLGDSMINIIVGSIAAGALGGIIGATSEISKFLKNKLTKPKSTRYI